jgi:hypothetical protein
VVLSRALTQNETQADGALDQEHKRGSGLIKIMSISSLAIITAAESEVRISQTFSTGAISTTVAIRILTLQYTSKPRSLPPSSSLQP